MNLQLHEAQTLPDDLTGDDVSEIAEQALQAGFAKIAEQLEARGYPVTGDFMPGETFQLEAAFRMFVSSMALNNPTISKLNDE
jgi:hypothetical protein